MYRILSLVCAGDERTACVGPSAIGATRGESRNDHRLLPLLAKRAAKEYEEVDNGKREQAMSEEPQSLP
jgi:hypothetical protein